MNTPAKYRLTFLTLLALLSVLTLPRRAFGQQSVEAFVNRGNASRASGDMNAAIASYTKAIELNPKLAAAYYSRTNPDGSRATGIAPSASSPKPLNSSRYTPPHKATAAKSKNTKTIRMLKWPSSLKPLNLTRDRPLLEASVAKSNKPKTIRMDPPPPSRYQ